MNRDQVQKNIGTKDEQSYLLLTFGIFLLLAIFLFAIDFVPELKLNADEQTPTSTKPVISVTSTEIGSDVEQPEVVTDVNVEQIERVTYTSTDSSYSPKRIVIRSIGVDTTVITPNSTDIDVLDAALLDGAVHYPGSGNLGENANVLIFGHSSYLPVVRNQAYKAFNELSKLKNGNEIVVYSENYKYVYSVDEVWLSEAQEVQVHFDANEPLLTLATCNTFGAKQDRWIVTASLESKNKIN